MITEQKCITLNSFIAFAEYVGPYRTTCYRKVSPSKLPGLNLRNCLVLLLLASDYFEYKYQHDKEYHLKYLFATFIFLAFVFLTNIRRKDHAQNELGEARAIWDVGHYGKSLYLQNSESSNCICVFHYSSVICRSRRASNIYIL